jgi:protein involved in polysaccharide export with SLBB domain
MRLTYLLPFALLMGCSTGATRFTLFPEGHPLDPRAEALRQTEHPLPVPRELDKHPLPLYTVEPGDVLLVLPAEIDTLPEEMPPEKNPPPPIRIPADQPVLLDGTINLGRYGLVQVAGKNVEEISGLVRATIQTQIKRDPGYITVRVVTRESKVYYVLGEVNTPGAFPLKGRETVLDGLMAAGGLNDRASRSNILLTRPTAPESCRVILPVCYRDITQLGDTTTNYQLEPGDRIIVPTRTGAGLFSKKKQTCNVCNNVQEACPMHAAPKPPVKPLPLPETGPVHP